LIERGFVTKWIKLFFCGKGEEKSIQSAEKSKEEKKKNFNTEKNQREKDFSTYRFFVVSK
jgi:hypothetical protein